ncbi:hypothetical protein PRK78_005761 [Emydomyces testavorans]|uniref:Low affinity iron transporter n=1 Tax=Emydomyces testavorans TaxID=2070801 RepID=A0AAF0DMT4_9EURO|nr:hypothetical protein PRK78_005761 [Emydomyces testavorans]
MDRCMKILRKPGAKGEIEGVAPTQLLPEKHDGSQTTDHSNNMTGYTARSKSRRLDRWLDVVVRASGSEFVFFSILAGLLTWALLGIKYGTSDNWQVLISDVQAIVSYVFDSFLVRQQLNTYEEEMAVAAALQSRILSHSRMLKKVHLETGDGKNAPLVTLVEPQRSTLEFQRELPAENWFGRFVTRFARALGHLVTICLFWAGVFVWIGIGPLYGWSDKWELYMNSASSALMVFTFAFLANIRERHSAYSNRCLDAIFKVDSALESRLRSLTGDTLSNPLVVIPAPKVNRVQRVIFYYADFVGTLVGIVLLLTVIIAWVAVGPLLQFSSNWWLLIGTYAGLVGMNDGFVLRNMQARLRSYVDVEFAKVDAEDEQLFAISRVPMPEKERLPVQSLTHRISDAMNAICAHELTVVAGFVTILGLIAGASAMRWSFTGQLLCNVPPSLIESFFMIILITGHNAEEGRKRVDLHNVYDRRLKLLSAVDAMQSLGEKGSAPLTPLPIEKADDLGSASTGCRDLDV